MTDQEVMHTHMIHKENAGASTQLFAPPVYDPYALSTPRITSNRSKASSPGSVASKVRPARTYITTGTDTRATAGAGDV